MIATGEVWQTVGLASNTACAAACASCAIWLMQRPLPWRRERIAGLVALLLTGLWAGVLAALGPTNIATAGAEGLRNLSWLVLIHALFASGVDRESALRVRFVLASLVFVELLQGALLTAEVAVLDDISRAPGEALNVLLRLLNERKYHERAIPLWSAVATGNPTSAEFYNEPLDPATLDRFALQVRTDGLVAGGVWEDAAAVVDSYGDSPFCSWSGGTDAGNARNWVSALPG